MNINEFEVLSPTSESKSESEPDPLKAPCRTVFAQGLLPGKVGDPD